MQEDKILETLQNEIGYQEYKKYICQLKYSEKLSNNESAVYIAPNILIANWIQTKYANKIEDILEKQTGSRVSVSIIIKNQDEKIKNVLLSRDIKKINKNNMLNPSYTFDNFVVGKSNHLAYSAAKLIVEKSHTQYNPVFLYGNTGIGKTHLIQAVGNYVINKYDSSLIYVTSEQFMNDFVYGLKSKSMDIFRKKYRKCDYLFIDDIQFFSNKSQIQEELFHTFNELHSNNKQIILTSDKTPKNIPGLENRLKSRFEWGLIASIKMPELETKIEIIKKKCIINKIKLGENIIKYIASNMGDNIREIEGAIMNLNAYSNLMKQDISLEFTKNIIKEYVREERENITLKDILNVVSKEINIKQSEIKSKNKNRIIVRARRITIYLARQLTPNSMPSIASFFNMKDHTAISKNMSIINKDIKNNKEFKIFLENLKNKIINIKKDVK